MTDDQAQFKQLVAARALELFPPSIQEGLLNDADFVDTYALATDAIITFGANRISFRRNAFLASVRQALAGAMDVSVTSVDATSWGVEVAIGEGRRDVAITQGKQKFVIPDLILVSPDREERLTRFDQLSDAAWSDDPEILELRRHVESAPIGNEDFQRIRSTLQSFPCHVARALFKELSDGESSVSLLAPDCRRYFERLVGEWTGQQNLTEFVATSGAAHISKQISIEPRRGLELALSMACHHSISEVIASQTLSLSTLIETFETLLQRGDRISQVGAIETGLALLRSYPELETFLPSLVKQILADDPAVEGRLTLLSGLIVFVDGEIARARTFAAVPPYWRRLATISHAALVEKQIIAAGLPLNTSFTAWAREGRGQYFFLQSMVDLRREPRWHPDFISPHQLKLEFLGRIVMAAQKHEDTIRSEELRSLLLENGPGSARSLLEFPFAFLPGPLEGGVETNSLMPEEVSNTIQERLGAGELQLNSFAALVNSALIFKMVPDHARLAAEALQRAKYQIRGEGGSDLHPSLLRGLATVAAVTRSQPLANDVRILMRGLCRRQGIDAEGAMRIGLIASAAFLNKDEWLRSVGDWMTELSFEDLDRQTAAKLLSHVAVLCAIEPELWRSCGRARAALTAVAG